MVSVEAAFALAGLMAVVTMTVMLLMNLLLAIRCQDAAREAARLASRGDGNGARSVVSELAGNRASLSVVVDGDLVRVTVTAPGTGFGPAPRGTATAALEPGAG